MAGESGASGLAQEVRGFLAGLRLALPEVYREAPPRPAPARRRPADPVRELFESRVRHWSAAMGVAPKRVFLKNQRTLWGSCSTRGNLNFNRVLAEAPAEIVDYVVIHELAHLKE
ncbi:MAG: M48 family metallopeptidase, partial [Elusimicrobia bacterium]|nr:M48 family metallopeptidase [Elusimicrobiota bacterium]